MNAGIDYGMGRTNIDFESGLRYGVISMGDVMQAWSDESEGDYGKACCPKCGNDALEYEDTRESQAYHKYGRGCHDWMCERCGLIFDSADAYPEEAICYFVDTDEYTIQTCLDSDLIVTKAPYFTRASYCSPCVPGACDLNDAHEDGAECFCLGHDWFDDGVAPYPVYSVATRELVAAGA